jgi:NADH-ubiquinone oxidoreductase chain 1
MSLVILGLGVYKIIFSGWSSKSKYRLIGSIRAIAITLRYEICMAIVFLSPVFLINNLSLNIFNHYYLNSTLYWQSLVI